LSPPLEWIGWGEGYRYIKDGGYEYVRGAWPPVEPPAGEGGYEYGEYPYGGCEGYEYTVGAPVEEGGGYAYGGGAPDKPPVGGGGYGYYGGYDDRDGWKIARGRGVGEALDQK
jgi:hypothetical protein